MQSLAVPAVETKSFWITSNWIAQVAIMRDIVTNSLEKVEASSLFLILTTRITG